MGYHIDDERKWRISKSGFSIKTGWADDKRIIASYPGATSPLDSQRFQQWLEDAERICDLYNHALVFGLGVGRVDLRQEQATVGVAPQGLEAVPHAAGGAHEVQPEAIEAGLGLVGSELSLAADANPHGGSIHPSPEQVPTITEHVCDGCPHLKTEYWKDYLDNDETDSGTTATCTKAGRHITSYWSRRAPPPAWCPIATQPAGDVGSGNG